MELNIHSPSDFAKPSPIVRAPGFEASQPFSSIENEYGLAHAQLGIVSSLFVALRAKHGPSASHSLRVALWASAWGIHNQVPENQLELFELVGLLHEIGKIGIPDRILQKPGALTENEHAMMDLHVQVGLEIVTSAGGSPDLSMAIGGIGIHFDSCLNSSSKKLSPIVSRMINIIDAYDSMTIRQVYRDPIPRETALAELIRLGGSQFDPALVRSFAEIVLNPHLDIQELIRTRWVAELDDQGISRAFQVDKKNATDCKIHADVSGSAIIQTLNDTFYRHMMDHVQDGVIFVDSEFRVLDWNSAAARMTGRSAESVFQQNWNPSFAYLCDGEGLAISDEQCPFMALMQTRQKIQQRLSIRREGVQTIHVDVEVIPVLNDRGLLCGGAMILEDVSETSVLEEKIVHLRERASQDQLTKVANRGELNRQMPEFVAYHQRTNRPGSAIICDIDFFKRINDNFSHQAGDEALIVFAKLLKDICRDTDFVARYGGEEFVLLCGQCDFTEAKEIAESIRKRLQRTAIPALRNACMTASFGVSTVLPEDTAESLLGRADKGLLIAKESGRDRVVGLGLEVGKLAENGIEPKRTNGAGWRSWLSPSHEPVLRFELLTNVPRNVTLEKLKGFVQEYQATVLHVEKSKAVLEVDCKNTPIPQIKNERLGRFRIEINISEVEMHAGGKKENVKVCTLLDVNIVPVRSRDRRSDALLSQVARLKTSLQGYLVACEMDETIRTTIIRTIKLETDSRY